jgi:hypothetical protein
MPQYLKYKLEDGSELLVEMPGPDSGVVQAGIGDKAKEAKQTFEAALASVKKSAIQIRNTLHDVEADQVKVKFGIKATGEAGNNFFAIGKVGVEANYEVVLKWDKKSSRRDDD